MSLFIIILASFTCKGNCDREVEDRANVVVVPCCLKTAINPKKRKKKISPVYMNIIWWHWLKCPQVEYTPTIILTHELSQRCTLILLCGRPVISSRTADESNKNFSLYLMVLTYELWVLRLFSLFCGQHNYFIHGFSHFYFFFLCDFFSLFSCIFSVMCHMTEINMRICCALAYDDEHSSYNGQNHNAPTLRLDGKIAMI